MDAEWTTEYPKEPGYYWLRGYRAKMGDYERIAPCADVVEVRKYQYTDDDGLRVKLLGESIALKLSDFIQAEWFGPIQPPEDKPQDKINTRATALGVFLGADKLDSRKE